MNTTGHEIVTWCFIAWSSAGSATIIKDIFSFGNKKRYDVSRDNELLQ